MNIVTPGGRGARSESAQDTLLGTVGRNSMVDEARCEDLC